MRMALWMCFALIFAPVLSIAQASPLQSGSTVYIEPMDGFENYLSAAIMKKHVPLVVIGDREKANFIVRSTVQHTDANQPQVVVNNTVNVNTDANDQWAQSKQRAAARSAARTALGSTSTSITIIDPKSSQIVYSYSASKGGTNHQIQSAAESCAKHLKEFIEKSEKEKNR